MELTTLTADEAETLLNSGGLDEIRRWNHLHAAGCHPRSWSRGSEEYGRGLTIRPDDRTNLHNVHFRNLDFGPVLSLSNCSASEAMFESVAAVKVAFETCTFYRCVFKNLSWHQAAINDCEFDSCIFLNCDFSSASLARSRFHGFVHDDLHLSCNFKQCNFTGCELQGAELNGLAVVTCKFDYSQTDSRTLLMLDHLDARTSFVGMSFSAARIAPSTRSQISLAIQRSFWHSVFADRERGLCRHLWRLFWFLFGYGFDLRRLLTTATISILFFSLFVGIASRYSAFQQNDGSTTPIPPSQCVSFVISTMTTLGFTDITPAPTSVLGHSLVICMFALGYILFAALIARLTTIANWPE